MSKYDDYDDSSGTAPPELPNLVFPALDICGRLPADHGDPVRFLHQYSSQYLEVHLLVLPMSFFPSSVGDRGHNRVCVGSFLQTAPQGCRAGVWNTRTLAKSPSW